MNIFNKNQNIPNAHHSSPAAVNSSHKIVIITGYSGAGKTTVLRALEDCGYLCIDNLPSALFGPFFKLISQSAMENQRIALGLDVRTGSTMQHIIQELERCSPWRKFYSILFLTSSPSILLKRFQETRRKHPLSDSIDLAQAIEQEKKLMRPFIDKADLILDTDQYTIHQLRAFVKNSFGELDGQKIVVTLVSFGFKHGVPPESNFVYDVSMLPNPFFIPELKLLTGKDSAIQNYLFEKQEVIEYWHLLIKFIRYSIKKSYDEGRFCITIAIGCTGGRHRSVAFVSRLAQESIENVQFLIKHRDIDNNLEHSI